MPSVGAGEIFHQEQAQFAAAITNSSTSPSFVFVTIMDGRTSTAQSGCLPAPFLEGAVQIERGLDHSMASLVAVKREILSNRSHVFTFRNPGALANLSFGTNETQKREYSQACSLIKAGLPAYQADRTGEIRAGQPFAVTPPR